MPQAYRPELAFIAHFKRVLATRHDMPVGERLGLFEWLGSCVRGPVTATALAAIEPASGGLMEAVVKAVRLNCANTETAFQVLERRLHPSLLSAIELCRLPH